jgi:hypothetical protein
MQLGKKMLKKIFAVVNTESSMEIYKLFMVKCGGSVLLSQLLWRWQSGGLWLKVNLGKMLAKAHLKKWAGHAHVPP